jgi:hypothetical protein
MARFQRGVLAAMALTGMIAAAAGAAAAGKTEGSASDAPSGSMRCAIRQSLQGNSILIEPIVEAGRRLGGAYRISLSGGGDGGSSSISQGGDFKVEAGSPTTLGRMRVDASGATYHVRLTVTANGESVSCSRQVSGPL